MYLDVFIVYQFTSHIVLFHVHVIGALAKLKTQHQEEPNSSSLAANKPTLLRSLFTVGALCRHFDFDQEEFKGANKVNTSNVLKMMSVELL